MNGEPAEKLLEYAPSGPKSVVASTGEPSIDAATVFWARAVPQWLAL
jgi:hypothetical protein